MGRQWRMGFAGPVALDLMPVLHELDRMGLEPFDYDTLLDDIQEMAAAALEQIGAQDST